MCIRNALFRPIMKPNIPLPFGVRSVGHYKIESPWRDTILKKNFLQLFWGIEGEGIFGYDSQEHMLSPGSIFIYFPGDVHDVRPGDSMWEYRWITFDGTMNSDIVKGFGLSRLPMFTGACPEELFMEVERNIHDISPFGQRNLSSIAYNILATACKVRRDTKDKNTPVERCLAYIRKHYAESRVNISFLADRVGIHRTNLSKQFKEKMGLSPIRYLSSYRTQKALSLLKETDFTVAEISRRTGFDDPEYFCKVIKKATGFNPSEFRKR